jgi:hypothetical protein
VADLAGLDELLDGARDVLDGHVRVHAVLVEEVDHVEPQASEALVGDLLDVIGLAIGAALLAVGREVEAELGGDDDAVADRSEGLPHEDLVDEGAVELGGVEEGNAVVDGGAKQGDVRLAVGARTVGHRHAHAAEAEGGDLEAAVGETGAKNSLVHVPRVGASAGAW